MSIKVSAWKLVFWLTLLASAAVLAQPETKPLPVPVQTGEISRERREQAVALLLEAQRYFWGLSRVRSQAAILNGVKLAKQALLKAVELDPKLSEAYTLLAELNAKFPPSNIEEAVLFGQIATKLNPDNFGGHLILAQIYTAQSRLNTPNLDLIATEKAIAQWNEITRLEPRNAEAWAFLSEFYGRTNQIEKKIEALKKWLSGSPPMEASFYRRIFGPEEDLKPENASNKLGETLFKAGRLEEAIEILGRSAVDYPENTWTIDLLRQSLQKMEGETSPKNLVLLHQAVFTNPSNLVLAELLAEYLSRLGKTDEAVKTLEKLKSNLSKADKIVVANLQISIGDLYLQSNRFEEATLAYEKAISTFGIGNLPLNSEEQREFVTKVFEKIIRTYKTAGKSNEFRASIDRSRILLGQTDLFADKQLINFLRETGKKTEALVTVRAVRKKFGEDYGLMRMEALILTDLGRVEEGVSLIKTLIFKKSPVPSPFYDDFSNYLFISGLYTQVKKNKEAVLMAQKAVEVAESEERKQLAHLSIATAKHQAGEFNSAETILRNILKDTPENPMALNNLGYFLLERNEKISEAVELIQKAVNIDTNNSSYLDSLGWGFFKLGKFEEAEKTLKQAIRLNSSASNIYEHLGDVYLKMGKIDSAQSAWQKALNFSFDLEVLARIKAKMAGKPTN